MGINFLYFIIAILAVTDLYFFIILKIIKDDLYLTRKCMEMLASELTKSNIKLDKEMDIVKNLLEEGRPATEEEKQSTRDYIDKISKPTGIKFDDLMNEE